MATSLLDWIMTLIKDTEAREAFQADPKAAMSAAGMSSICGDDIRDARPFLLDNPSVKQVRPYEPAEHKDTSEQIREIVENHKERDGHKEREEKEYREEEVVFKSDKGTKIEDSYHEDSYNKYSKVEDNDIVTGPASGDSSTSSDQSRSVVSGDQTAVGGRGNVVGDGNNLSENKTENETENTQNGNNVNGNGNVGGDFEQGGDVRGDTAGRDMDDIGGLVGLKDVRVIDDSPINVLNIPVGQFNDVLNNALREGILNDLLRGSTDAIDINDVVQVAIATAL